MNKELQRGCVVFMKASSGLTGYGNAQCISGVHGAELGTISLYGHNQHYKTYDIDKVVEYPTHQAENAQQVLAIAALEKVRNELRAELDAESMLVKIRTASCNESNAKIEQLEAENKKLNFALKSSIEITEALEGTIRTMNKVGLKFGINPFQLTPPPPFIKQSLKDK